MELVASETEEYLFLSAASGQRHVQHDKILSDQPRGWIVAVTKLRRSDPKSKNERYDEEMSALDAEIKRMRAQRLRLERDQRKRD
jgi:hypothetical protein